MIIIRGELNISEIIERMSVPRSVKSVRHRLAAGLYVTPKGVSAFPPFHLRIAARPVFNILDPF